jgi:hypothetical protein
MFKKYKQFFMGLIIGAILFSAIPIHAAVEEFILYKANIKLMLNGREVQVNNLPILQYKGYNYLPAASFKDICTDLGASFYWDTLTKQIQIKSVDLTANNTSYSAIVTKPVMDYLPSTPTKGQTPPPSGYTVKPGVEVNQPASTQPTTEPRHIPINESTPVKKTPDGLNVYNVDGKEYVIGKDFGLKYWNTPNRYIVLKMPDDKNNPNTTTHNALVNNRTSETILKYVEFTVIDELECFEYNYYINTVLPAVSQ